MGRVRVMLPTVGSTLLAMAKLLWKTVLMSSKDQVEGSVPSVEDQLMVTDPPEVAPEGAVIDKAATKGVRRARRATLLNILEQKEEGREVMRVGLVCWMW